MRPVDSGCGAAAADSQAVVAADVHAAVRTLLRPGALAEVDDDEVCALLLQLSARNALGKERYRGR